MVPATLRQEGLGAEKNPGDAAGGFPKEEPKAPALRGKLELSGGVVGMYITGEQGNGILHTMVGCNVLALVPAGSGALAKGTVLEGYWMDGKTEAHYEKSKSRRCGGHDPLP